MEFVFILIGIAALAFLCLIAKEFANVAKEKGYSQKKYFWYSFLLGIIGYLLVVALPDRGKKQERIVVTAPTIPVKNERAEDAQIEQKPIEQKPKERVKLEQAKVVIVDDKIECPSCGTKQKGNRNVCYNCGCKFIKE